MLKSFIAVLLVIAVIGCNKTNGDDDGYVYINGSGLAGKWVATERYSSPGSGGSWNALPKDEWFTIEFKGDSSFTYSSNFPKADSAFSQYRLSGSLMRIFSLVNSKTDRWYYGLDADGKLSLSIFLCIEGCAYGLRRIQ